MVRSGSVSLVLASHVASLDIARKMRDLLQADADVDVEHFIQYTTYQTEDVS